MPKERERLYFKWQKNSNEFAFSVTLLLALFAIRNEFSGAYKLIIYFLFPIIIFIAGTGLIKLNLSEMEYLKQIKDGRFNISKWQKIKQWILVGISIIVGIIMVYVAMQLWRESFLAVYG